MLVSEVEFYDIQVSVRIHISKVILVSPFGSHYI